jgi:hypothetical protein
MGPHASFDQEQPEQTTAVLCRRRRWLLAGLAAERAELLWQVLDVDERALSELPVLEQDDWTVKDLLAHISAWDRWEHRTMAVMLAGEQPDFIAVEDIDAFNAAAVAKWRDRSLSEVLAELRDARATWLAWLRQVPPEAFFQPRWFQDWDWRFPNCLEVQWQHDAEHAKQIAAWRHQNAPEGSSGPKAALSAALDAARQELLAAAALVPPEDRMSRCVCGEWTLKDVVGHLADWEWVGVEGLRDMAAGRTPQCEQVADIESWNQAHVEARRDQLWEEIWADLQGAREGLAGVLDEMSEEALARSHRFPWGPQGTAYLWVRVFISHDREHAKDLRVAMRGHAEWHGPT